MTESLYADDHTDLRVPEQSPRSLAFVRCAVAIVTLLVLIPFLNKAFHIDDALFLRVADQILEDPLRPYNFEYNWYNTPESGWWVNQNPPLVCYLLAGLKLLFGENEFAYHVVFLAFPVGCALLMHALARRFCRRPVFVTLLSVASPAFLVSATNVMADVPLFFFWLLAVHQTVRAVETGRSRYLWTAGIAASAAAMTKYFGVALVPLLVVYWVAGRRRFSPHVFALGLPIAVLTLWGFYSLALGDVFHPLGAARYSQGGTGARIVRLGPALCFFGGGVVWPLILAPRLFLQAPWKLPAVCMLTACGFFLADGTPEETHFLFWIAMTTAGAVLAAVCLEAGVWELRPDSLLLVLWFFGTLAFVWLFNWTINARVVLPAVFPAAVLAIRVFESPEGFRLDGVSRAVALALTIFAGVTVAWADLEYADTFREFARSARVQERIGKEPLYFTGHWGFQHYMERAGGVAYDADSPDVPVGSCVVHSAPNTNDWELEVPAETVFKGFVPARVPLHTMRVKCSAGFYSNVFGAMPFGYLPDNYRIAFHIERVVEPVEADSFAGATSNQRLSESPEPTPAAASWTAGTDGRGSDAVHR